MKVTEHGAEYRQSREESRVQRIPAEQERYAQAYIHERITESNNTDANIQTDNLLEKILHRDNLNRAYKRVKKNHGACGIDEMSVDEALPYLKENGADIIRQIKERKYKPTPVRRVEIPKEEKGKSRKLGIPTVVDRVIQQAIAQVLTPIFEKQFSDNSFGFRPGRNQHGALKRCKKYVDEGYKYVVDMDLAQFFDTVNQSMMIEILSRTIKDNDVISLINKFLNAGVMQDGLFTETKEGLAQGGPSSPLLSNIMLNELDSEIERRGHKFVRFADDCLILCKSKKSAERTLRNLIPFIENKLLLKVNREKTVIASISKVRYLGYGFYFYKGVCRFKVHPKSIMKMENKIRELITRKNKWSNEERIREFNDSIRGWINYFKLADMKKLLTNTDEWIRRRIRAIYWKQWKKVKTRYKMMRAFGIPEWKVRELANCRKGIWRAALMLNPVLNNKRIADLGYMSMVDYYLNVRIN